MAASQDQGLERVRLPRHHTDICRTSWTPLARGSPCCPLPSRRTPAAAAAARTAEEGRRLPARARLLHTPTKGTAVDHETNIMVSRFSKIQEKREELYNLVADFERTYKTPFRISWQNCELLHGLSTQIEPRPSDPYWRMLRIDQRRTSFFGFMFFCDFCCICHCLWSSLDEEELCQGFGGCVEQTNEPHWSKITMLCVVGTIFQPSSEFISVKEIINEANIWILAGTKRLLGLPLHAWPHDV